MIMKYKILTAALLIGSGILGACTEEFSELNSKPSDISNPNLRFLFTQCEYEFQPADYYQWYGGFNDLTTWAQTTVPGSGNSSNLNYPTEEAVGCGYRVNNVLRYANDIRYHISLLNDAEKEKYEYFQYLCNPLCVYLSIQDADLYGSRQYSEAEMARYTNPPLLLPKYDTQEELVEIWLKELDSTLDYLMNHNVTDLLSSQDFIYRGDLKKWAKLTNSLKLKIAARLINKNRQRAIQIAESVANHPAGVLTELEDDFVYNKGKFDNNWNNNFSVGVGTNHLINFMVENRDPRLFYFFQKNDYNANVVKAYFEQDRPLPSYIEEKIEYSIESGKKVFQGWKSPGEPWVRYQGIPCEIGAKQNAQYNDYFDPTGELFVLYTKDGNKKTYSPFAYRNQEMIKGLLTYTYPDSPDVAPVQDKEQHGWYGMYFSAGEVNLLFAEFKLLGASLPKTAQEYLNKGVEMSARSFDAVAAKNHIPYYDAAYANDKYDVSIKLQEEQIIDMLNSEVCHLTGNKADDLEKVYIQQYLHYFTAPIDQYVNIMRSGVPMNNSTLLPRVYFDNQLKDNFYIPRRFAVSKPLDSDKLKDVTIEAYKQQGYTFDGTEAKNPEVLNKERVWIDQENPQFGEGPKM